MLIGQRPVIVIFYFFHCVFSTLSTNYDKTGLLFKTVIYILLNFVFILNSKGVLTGLNFCRSRGIILFHIIVLHFNPCAYVKFVKFSYFIHFHLISYGIVVISYDNVCSYDNVGYFHLNCLYI